jgi:glyoxylase-like metal-dependent hydrolase (beta-lactamase superfamily II)
MLPPYGASNVLTKPTIEPVANRVWLVRGGMDWTAIALQTASGKLPRRTMNVYLIKEHDGVTMFDAGVAAMAEPLRRITERMGGLKRIVLGHAHGDHRGAAPALRSQAPVYCHPDAKQEAQTAGLPPYQDHSAIPKRLPRMVFPRLAEKWDGGPVKIDGTVDEGDDVAGFEVKLFDGHAPGLIGLWREQDRLCLCTDTVYTLDPLTGEFGHARTPLEFANMDTQQAKRSIRRLAALEPSEVWPGHADPVRGSDVQQQLERAAAS